VPSGSGLECQSHDELVALDFARVHESQALVESARPVVARIQAALRGLAVPDEAAPAELAEALTAYTALLRAHIGREVVGGGVHEAFHALRERLGDVYAE